MNEIFIMFEIGQKNRFGSVSDRDSSIRPADLVQRLPVVKYFFSPEIAFFTYFHNFNQIFRNIYGQHISRNRRKNQPENHSGHSSFAALKAGFTCS